MPADGYLGRVLADGASPFRYRGGVRALLGEPDGPGLLRPAPPAPRPLFSYPRPAAWPGEIELPGAITTMGMRFADWPAGDDPPPGDSERGTAVGGMSRGTLDELPEPGTGYPPAFPRLAVTTEQAPVPGTSAGLSVGVGIGPAAAAAEQARHMTAEPAQTPAAEPARSQEPDTGPGPDTGPAPAWPASAAARRGPEPMAFAGGSRELRIPGRTVRPPVMTEPEEAGTGPTGITARKPAMADSPADLTAPVQGPVVRRIPPRHMGATAQKHDGGTVITGGRAAPDRVRRPAGPGRQADIVPAGQADAPLPRRPKFDAGIRGRVEQPPAAAPTAAPAPAPASAPVSAPALIVMSPPRTPTVRPTAPPAPLAFWERRHLGRLWSRPVR